MDFSIYMQKPKSLRISKKRLLFSFEQNKIESFKERKPSIRMMEGNLNRSRASCWLPALTIYAWAILMANLSCWTCKPVTSKNFYFTGESTFPRYWSLRLRTLIKHEDWSQKRQSEEYFFHMVFICFYRPYGISLGFYSTFWMLPSIALDFIVF